MLSILFVHGPEPGLGELGVLTHAYHQVRRQAKERSCRGAAQKVCTSVATIELHKPLAVRAWLTRVASH